MTEQILRVEEARERRLETPTSEHAGFETPPSSAPQPAESTLFRFATAGSVDDVITEVAATRITERGATRADDRTSEAAMEDRKKEGYF